MELNQPKVITWWIAVIVGAVGIILNFAGLPAIAFWLVVAGLVLLALGNALKGL